MSVTNLNFLICYLVIICKKSWLTDLNNPSRPSLIRGRDSSSTKRAFRIKITTVCHPELPPPCQRHVNRRTGDSGSVVIVLIEILSGIGIVTGSRIPVLLKLAMLAK